ncbi:MAG: hypothetical protein WCE94_00705 [Candidatus Methanoperedens sp.]
MKLLSSETAASEVIGHILILFITILGISMIALYGVPAIYSLEDTANSKNSEQAFTVLDSRASRATLGESPLQVTNINLGGGTLTVEPNTSFMVVNSSNFNVNISMGRVKYTLGDRIVAYEGGGVWAQYPGGGTVMLTPPEIHFDGVTLTLPVINIYGNSSVGGKGTAVVSFKKNATLVQYPNTSIQQTRTNPVNYTNTGKVFVNITSDYYLAWADYAESLGYTKVTTNPTKHTTYIELRVVPSTLGEITYLANTITFRGLNVSDPTPLDNFSFRIGLPGNSPWNLNWDIRAKTGNKTLIFYLKGTGLKNGDPVDYSIGYQDGSMTETWNKDNAFLVQGGFVDVDLLNKSVNLNYDSETVGSNNACPPVTKVVGITNPDFSWDDLVINTSASNPNRIQSSYNITQHYFWKMAQTGDISFGNCGSQQPSPGTSTMLVDYIPTGALTYLHITENRADVAIS